MAAVKREITRCGLCRFYSHEGRRGGLCSQLSVKVGSYWTACALASSPFIETEKIVGIADWAVTDPAEKPVVEKTALPLNGQPAIAPIPQKAAPPKTVSNKSISKKQASKALAQ